MFTRTSILARLAFIFPLVIFISNVRAQVDWPQLKLTQIAAGLSAPVHAAGARDGSGRLFVVEQPGRIKIAISNSILPQPFLDITNRVSNPFASVYGLLSVAFPPNFSTRNYFYTYYSRTNDQATVISRFFVSGNTNQADPSSEQVIMVIPLGDCAPGVIGGQIAFGPDGFLYISTGDEPSCGGIAPAQDPGSLWGKILRIDVESSTNGYRVPTNNPFISNPAYLPEIWALGLRNPWRFSFDRSAGDLYIADVGQSLWEEINFQPASSPGGQNYGWDVMEGYQFHGGDTSWDTNALTFPIFVYPHTNPMATAVAGGFVYRGPSAPRMNGIYFFGDSFIGEIWGLARQGTNWLMQEFPVPKHFISSFGEDDTGQLYLVDYGFGKVYRIEDSGLTGPPEFDPPGGVVPADTVKVTSASPGAAIHYTTNGAAPLETDPIVGSNGMLVVTSGMTLMARAFRSDLQPSTVTSGTFTLQAAKPVFSPRHGPVTNGTLLTMSSSTVGASITYTLDGSDPTPSSPLYASPFPIYPTNIVSARAFKTGFNDSLIQRVNFSGAVALTNLILYTGGALSFSWASETGRTYQVQVSSNLVNWTDTTSPQAGTDAMQSLLVSPAPGTRFFRMRVY